MKAWLSNIFGKEQMPPPVEGDEVALPQVGAERGKPGVTGQTVLATKTNVAAEWQVGDGRLDQKGDCSCLELPQDPIPAIWNPGQLLLGDFEVERTLGEGGMGKVYLLRNRSTGSRFAVKHAKGIKEDDRRNFLAEVRSWIALPSHPNLLRCDFVRTVGSTILVFAEFVEGGSLKDWVDDKRLYCGSQKEVLTRILDLAVQWAWALHVVHELGFVHQDVKPGNLLVTSSGVAKVSDFGLARARAAASEVEVSGVGRSILVSWGGMTAAYCSPEQAEIFALRQNGSPTSELPKLTQKTDIWSLGVSIFEMFYGEPPCRYGGQTACEVFDSYLSSNSVRPVFAEMPAPLISIIKKCLRKNPSDRWSNCSELAFSLKNACREITGAVFLRPLVKPPELKASLKAVGSSRVSWQDGAALLAVTMELIGRKVDTDSTDKPGVALSMREQATADLASYGQAQLLLESAVSEGQTHLQNDLATLYMHKARIHQFLYDYATMLELYRKTFQLYELLVSQTKQTLDELPLVRQLVSALNEAVDALYDIGELQQALRFSEQASARCANLLHHSPAVEDKAMWIQTMLSYANILVHFRNYDAADSFYNRVIETCSATIFEDKSPAWINMLAKVTAQKGHMLFVRGEVLGAIDYFDKAIALFGQLGDLKDHCDIATNLAWVCFQKATALCQTKEFAASLPIFDRTLGLCGYIQMRAPSSGLQKQIALACREKAIALAGIGDVYHSKIFIERAVREFEALIDDGRHDIADELKRAREFQQQL